MGIYIIRTLKYFLKLVIVITLALSVLGAFDMLSFEAEMILTIIFTTWRGAVLLGAIVLFAIAYPQISFTKADVRGNLKYDFDEIVNAFKPYKYSLVHGDENGLVFRADSIVRRILWQFDDVVKVTANGNYIHIEGTKKIVPRVELRLNAYISDKYGLDEK